MEDTPFMRVMDGRSDKLDIAGGTRRRQRLLTHELRQALAFHIIHREIVPTFVDAHVVNRHDVRMLKDGGSRGLRPEPLHEVLSRERTTKDQFYRDGPPEALLARPVNDPHPP